ncbi:uncharacterized protein CTHT_0047200 [Thermochaetoides thermophila DSM 1495]|uniref:DUF1237 domain-containing protein n=1 Tax=Chaetomium thermophilum (strain DSM 1495 / CBS 144.50 / IMI 039719) TaxID=759272 RepID=G0S9U4_CHATD|nr:hypothetical protein CTHT_0047200 [Thermochaetoides thermophila DSM 1495]EGS20205.1 hypothetical protein CTHT_0047200 [Thermochaetoides thermophila DSM 1495]
MKLPVLLLFTPIISAQLPLCPNYADYSKTRHPPFTSGIHSLPFQRPPPHCRTFNSSAVESHIVQLKSEIADPDLAQLFENAWPNTLDTAVRWFGRGAEDDEELAFIVTGDINAMWLRDSAAQVRAYLRVLEPDHEGEEPSVGYKVGKAEGDTASLAALFRGVINLQARYILSSPFCNAFQPPAEAGIPRGVNEFAMADAVAPPPNGETVFECKFEIDSLAAFLHLSADYHDATHHTAFFSSAKNWLPAIRTILSTLRTMQSPTYDPQNGTVLPAGYTFQRQTTRATETTDNDGRGHPARRTGMVRTAFRPSDDAAALPYNIPGNMMIVTGLARAATIADAVGDKSLADKMRALQGEIDEAVKKFGIVPILTESGDIERVYAYEVDGFGSALHMDDANVPSLLSIPLLGYSSSTDEVYLRTRARVLSPEGNGYLMRGPALSAVGGPHVGPGWAWPMASIVRVLTAEMDDEIRGELKALVGSTSGLGLVHESVNTQDGGQWTRQR